MAIELNCRTTWTVGLAAQAGVILVPKEAIANIVDVLNDAGITSFTVQKAKGFWQGEKENTLLVSVLHTVSDQPCIGNHGPYFAQDVAAKLAGTLNQACVLYEQVPVFARFINGEGEEI